MSRFIVAAFDCTANSDATQILHSREMWLNCPRIFHSVQRYFRIRAAASLPFVALRLICSVFFLQLRGIKEDNLGYLCRRLGAIYLACIAFSHQFRQKPAVVEMGVSQKDSINRLGVKLEGLPVSFLMLPLLVQSAIYEYSCVMSFQKIAGTGDVPRRTQECQLSQHR
jgi:hypothetical protein